MSSRREEERNEKIIRGLMKLPPNRRCINCNSLGPQYACTNFWTFVCTTCSGIHREFTHRVKSVSMAKFTSQEVDSLQKGGNQRARELYLKTWNPQNRLPDNSNADKVREFIKNVYVNRKYAQENSSDRPPSDPQGSRNHEDDMRRASSYHSYSQSPPYDFEYEERRYGKHAPTLTRKPGSDRGLYEGKLTSFLSPSRFSDHSNDDMFGNEGSLPRASDFSVSSGGDPFKSDVLSPSSQRDTGNPFSGKSNGGRTLHPQRTPSSGSFESFHSNSMSFKSVTSIGSLEAASPEPEPPAEISHDTSSSFYSPVQHSVAGTFDGFAPQNVTSIPPTGSNSQFPGPSLTQPVDLFQQQTNHSSFTERQPSQVQQPSLFNLLSPLTQQQPSASSSGKISDGVMLNEGGWATVCNSQFPGSSRPVELIQQQANHSSFSEQPSHVQQPSLFDLFSPPTQQKPTASSSGKISDEIMPNEGGWASFDMDDTGSFAPAAVPVSRQNNSGNFNPFSFDQSSDSAGHDPAAATSNSFWHEGLQNVETTTSSAPLWNAFEDSVQRHPITNVLQNREQAISDSNVDRSLGFSVSEGLYNGGNVKSPLENETPVSNLTSHINTASLQDFSKVFALTGSRSIATDHNPSNPFNLPYDSDMESGNMCQFWDMNSLQAGLPNTQKPASCYAGDVNQSWFSHNPIRSGGVALDRPSANNILTMPMPAAQGGNPFA